MRRISSATLELPEDTLVILPFHFLFMRKPTPACPLLASEWYSRWPLWRVVKLSSFLRTSPSPITSHFMLFSFSSSSSSCTCSSFSNVLTLYVAIFSRSPLVWWFFLTQRFLAPPVCSLGGSEPPPRQWRIVGSRGHGARNSVGPSAMVRPNVCQMGGAGSPPVGSEAEPRRQTHVGNNIGRIENWLKIRYLGRCLHT